MLRKCVSIINKQRISNRPQKASNSRILYETNNVTAIDEFATVEFLNPDMNYWI